VFDDWFTFAGATVSPICLLAAAADSDAHTLPQPIDDFDGVIVPFDGPVASLRDARLPIADARWRRVMAVDLALFAPDDPVVVAHPALFAMRVAAGSGAIDPRAPAAAATPVARLHGDDAAEVLAPVLADALVAAVAAGADGFVLTGAERFGAAFARAIVDRIRSAAPDALLFAQGGDADVLAPLRLDGLITRASVADLVGALPRWAGTPVLAVAAADLLAQAAAADGLVISAELLATEPQRIRRAVSLVHEAAVHSGARRIAGTTILRADAPDWREATAVLSACVNDGAAPAIAPAPALPGFAREIAVRPIASREVDVAVWRRTQAVRAPALVEAGEAAGEPRLVVEQITPGVDDGLFPVKRVVGEPVTVTAAVFADGHEQLAAELLWRPVDEREWRRVAMESLPNDGWRASFTPERLGRHEFAVEGWLDRFGGFRRDFGKKLDAGVAQPVDHQEGIALVVEAASRSADPALAAAAEQLRAAADDARIAQLLLLPELQALMRAADDRPHRLRSVDQPLDAERIEARFSSWYELFPRSITDDLHRHGTFRDVIGRLPAIRDMGFDTLYFPPIHPIGKTNRKGPNNTLTPGPDDPGSPYAIGSAAGGHEALHPELGTFEDFHALIAAARGEGLEIAIDFAIQCSPDHPWLTQHPGWFAWRPDGSMKYAENPPKKYQDIVNVDFYGPEAVPGLWCALRDVVLLWCREGVRTFRVDNPHTKPLPFWQWMIGEVRRQHPDAIFLAEAFTRPAMMYRLAKIGFSQSYTYFTWRDGKQELIDYIRELSTEAPKDFYRPHFFVNTPDINPIYLQTSGRPGFRVRAVLAATLSGLFGVYSGFELCEAAALPGKEEYLDSEKYELRPRDWNAPGNIVADITLLNRLRRDNPALQTHLNTRFYEASDEAILYYGKPGASGGGLILVMANLDPHNGRECDFDVPLWELGLPDDGSVAVEDLARGYRFDWHGKRQFIRLDPDEPYRIWRIAPKENMA
jgi:starch synthase (maltosyl-transferring)